ncbi:toast rack family protein [Sporosarcina sp. Te-1]|uniref:toast rack family protein n=1 Tax=Sporosarcina sp. Te-1 TaxID=2818390 RepID=UPI001A9F8B37|nr:toast rack family protein [Sporosarcina sp. Te-1]QTD39933.1 hypothetical protein J3U78_13975 [Sporosarcina sp. Te-1]
MKKILWIGLIGGFLIVLGLYGYDRIFASVIGKEHTIERDNAKALHVDLDFGAGELLVSGGSDEWMNGKFLHNSSKHAPQISYKEKRGTGFLDIKQRSRVTFGFTKRKFENDWNIQLTDKIPLDLDIDMGVSDTTLDLKGLQLNKLTIDSGVSDSTIDLSGDWKESFPANIDIGVGDSTLLLPKQTGVRLSISRGIANVDLKDFISKGNGIYVNEAFDKADVIIDITMNIGIGDVEVKLVD